jgi:alpha-galactosidase/6-phospho-beta-glucosidase family protein
MPPVKIVMVGGGSYQWTPVIGRDLMVQEHLRGSTFMLYDLDPEPLPEMTELMQMIAKAAGTDFAVKATTSPQEAFDGADFAILSITTGGYDMMEHDLAIPAKYGIFQSVGDTVGPGGLVRALRNVPVIVQIGRMMEQYCPKAWMLNLTNPMSVLTRTFLRETSIKTVGLCHELFGTMELLLEIFGLEDQSNLATESLMGIERMLDASGSHLWQREMSVEVGGINHCIWMKSLSVRGQDGFLLLRQFLEDPEHFVRNMPPPPGKKEREAGDLALMMKNHQLKLELFKLYNVLPAAGDKHVAEFYPYLLHDETYAAERFGITPYTIEWQRDSRSMYKNWVDWWKTGQLPLQLERSEELASDVIVALAGGKPVQAIVNRPNEGQIANLPQDVVVESMARVDADGIQPRDTGELPAPIQNLLYRHIVNQEMIVDAALSGDRQLALQTLLNDPLVNDYDNARFMLDEMIEATKGYLPQFQATAT